MDGKQWQLSRVFVSALTVSMLYLIISYLRKQRLSFSLCSLSSCSDVQCNSTHYMKHCLTGYLEFANQKVESEALEVLFRKCLSTTQPPRPDVLKLNTLGMEVFVGCYII